MAKQLNFFDGLEDDDVYDYKQRSNVVKKEMNNQLEALFNEIYDIEELHQLFTILDVVDQIKKNKYPIKIASDDFYRIFTEHEIFTDWQPQTKAYFKKAYDILVHWKDFFFSYTNKQHRVIDNKFKEVITEFADYDGSEDIVNNDRILKIAHIIHYHLEDDNLSSFFDKKNLTSGDQINETLHCGCNNAFAFVQLIHQYSFQYPEEGQKNWCFEEYLLYKNGRTLHELIEFDGIKPKSAHFISLYDNTSRLFPAEHGIIKEWIEDIIETKHTPVTDISSNEELIDLIKSSEIPKKIKKYRENVVSAIKRYRKTLPRQN